MPAEIRKEYKERNNSLGRSSTGNPNLPYNTASKVAVITVAYFHDIFFFFGMSKDGGEVKPKYYLLFLLNFVEFCL